MQGVQQPHVTVSSIGVFETFLNISLSVFPNPTKGTSTLAISNPLNDQSRVVITNALGQVIQTLTSSELLANEITLNLTPYESGIYFVTVYTGALTTTNRIVKN